MAILLLLRSLNFRHHCLCVKDDQYLTAELKGID